MPKSFTRIAALLLIPCLVADSVSSAPCWRASALLPPITDSALWTREALSARSCQTPSPESLTGTLSAVQSRLTAALAVTSIYRGPGGFEIFATDELDPIASGQAGTLNVETFSTDTALKGWQTDHALVPSDHDVHVTRPSDRQTVLTLQQDRAAMVHVAEGQEVTIRIPKLKACTMHAVRGLTTDGKRYVIAGTHVYQHYSQYEDVNVHSTAADTPNMVLNQLIDHMADQKIRDIQVIVLYDPSELGGTIRPLLSANNKHRARIIAVHDRLVSRTEATEHNSHGATTARADVTTTDVRVHRGFPSSPTGQVPAPVVVRWENASSPVAKTPAVRSWMGVRVHEVLHDVKNQLIPFKRLQEQQSGADAFYVDMGHLRERLEGLLYSTIDASHLSEVLADTRAELERLSLLAEHLVFLLPEDQADVNHHLISAIWLLEDFYGQKEKHPVDLHRFVRASVEGLRVESHREHIQVTTTYQAALPAIVASSIEMHRLLDNVLRNAMDVLRQADSERHLHIETTIETGERPVVLRISDTGMGIPADQLSHLFEPFTTNGPEERRKLGMVIIKESVEDLGATIEVESEAGKGTTFTIRFPAVAPEVQDRASLRRAA